MSAARAERRALALLFTALTALACARRSDGSADAASSSSVSAASASAKPVVLPAPVASGVPFDPKVLSDAVNPDGKAAYSGPVGILEGRIVASGDPPIEQPEIAQKIPENCKSARPFYAKVFREGADRALADVFVAVTGYHEYIPAREPAKRFVAKDCTFGTRTIALTLGQRVEVVSGDKEAYIPDLLGEHGQAQIVAVPGGQVASTHFPTKIGRFVLIDNLRLFMTAEVLVVKYATMAVTGIDGRYRIEGLPPGNLRLGAMLPATGGTVERPVAIEAGKTTTVDLAIPFDEKAHRQAMALERADAGARDTGTAPSARPKAGTSRAPSAKP